MKKPLDRLTDELFPLGAGIASQFVHQMYSLPPARFGVRTQRNIEVPAADGIALLTDIYTPKDKGGHPTLVMRTPYGRFGFGVVAQIYAEHGFRTVLQACRGTDGSGGEFNPLVNEREDGLATLEWIKQQDWFDGRLGTTGPSYLGYAQWAICDALPQGAAISAKSTSSDFQSIVFPNDAFSLQLWLSWLQTVDGLDSELFGMTLRMATGDVERRTKSIAMQLPLAEADVAAIGKVSPFWRQWFEQAIDNPPFWDARRHTQRLDENTPPNCFVTGWYDLMLDEHLADYQRLVAAGHTPHLTIGRWTHTDNELQGACLSQTLSWMSAHLLGQKHALRKKPVRIYISGSEKWLESDTFPPAPTSPETFFLREADFLGLEPGTPPGSTSYRYDPADPTPNIGGAIFAFVGAGARDNEKLEARADVRTFTCAPLHQDLVIIGNARIVLYVRSSLEHTDFFVRLCDVDLHGVSTNISDAIMRMKPGKFSPDAKGVCRLEFPLHACAHTFLKGHRIRLQVSSGAHPRFARNLGTDEPIGTATKMVAADQEIFHGKEYPSAVSLPVCKI
ncbi:MAG TPA: CocE/NonD family hydrolase [Devosia sp.]|nr:CocE/NonD family hydrolase [Devosia sp.]